jgi:hypothetical protein
MSAIDEVAAAAIEPNLDAWHWYQKYQQQNPMQTQRMGDKQAFSPTGFAQIQQGQKDYHQGAQQAYQDYLSAPPVVGENVAEPEAPAPSSAMGEQPLPSQGQPLPQMGPVQAMPRPQVQQMPQSAPNWENLIGLGMDRLIQGRLREQQGEMLPMQGGREDGYRR